MKEEKIKKRMENTGENHYFKIILFIIIVFTVYGIIALPINVR